jgi:hypothetical protein
MKFNQHTRGKIEKLISSEGARFLENGLDAICRILPHAETFDWRSSNEIESRVAWNDNKRRELRIIVALPKQSTSISGKVRRRRLPSALGPVKKTLDVREYHICKMIVEGIDKIIKMDSLPPPDALDSIQDSFDERIVASHLKVEHKLVLDPAIILRHLRALAEQTYENRPMAFGCIIDKSKHASPDDKSFFPSDYFRKKKYRALSDGYHTSYVISTKGAVVGFEGLGQSSNQVGRKAYYPEWAGNLAVSCSGGRIGIALTRQGDILVIDNGSVRFTYRLGKWQYWNHTHLVNLLTKVARVQHVPTQIVPRVVAAVYRAALDVSFRRTGGLFVLLKNSQNIRALVRQGDAINDADRSSLDSRFDKILENPILQTMPRLIAAEIASLDGAVVLNNQGHLLAYGAVLEPSKKGKISPEEGSRTKAAIGSSNYGLAVKVSSDGDITIYSSGKEFIRI